MADSARAPEERIRAHMLRFLIGSFPFGTPPPDGARVAANRRWLPRELMELYAEEAATELLGRGSEGDPEIRRDAHIVRCFTCPDHRSVEVHMEALLVDGDENAIVQGCCGASEEFHQETACRFLNRALAAVTKEKEIARLLEYKLSVLLGLYMRESVEGEDQEEQRDAVYRDFVATMAHLELCGGAPFERAHGHVYFAIFAEWHSECALAELHCDMAQVLAEHLQNPRFQQDVAHCREWILSEENDEAQVMDEDDEDSKDYDEDADDDDDGEEWKRAYNCSRKRGSFSKKSRMSGMPSRIMIIRSTPNPKAKPCQLFGSMPQLARTLGCAIPQPAISIHSPSFLHRMSISRPGSDRKSV